MKGVLIAWVVMVLALTMLMHTLPGIIARFAVDLEEAYLEAKADDGAAK